MCCFRFILAFQTILSSKLSIQLSQIDVVRIEARNSRRLLDTTANLVEGDVGNDYESQARALATPLLDVGPEILVPDGTIRFYQLIFRVRTSFLPTGIISSSGLAAVNFQGTVDRNVLFSEAPYIKLAQVVLQARVGRKFQLVRCSRPAVVWFRFAFKCCFRLHVFYFVYTVLLWSIIIVFSFECNVAIVTQLCKHG